MMKRTRSIGTHAWILSAVTLLLLSFLALASDGAAGPAGIARTSGTAEMVATAERAANAGTSDTARVTAGDEAGGDPDDDEGGEWVTSRPVTSSEDPAASPGLLSLPADIQECREEQLNAKPEPGPAVTHHEIKVSIVPGEHRLSVVDTITPSEALRSRSQGVYHFLIHHGLRVGSPLGGVSIRVLDEAPRAEMFGLPPDKLQLPEAPPLDLIRVQTPPDLDKLILAWSGVIDHPLETGAGEMARGFSETPGIISDEGIFLSGESYWLPWSGEDLLTFTLDLRLPPGWDAVSQGRRTEHVTEAETARIRWESPEPQDQVYIAGARFSEYDRDAGDVHAMAMLREPDEGLAGKYLEVTGQYLKMYGDLLGSYPYSKFALVENFWETGYGMPSFTLLGPKVIRLPFILHSSYPHEILHNWWGNGVFVDYETGNWCEGLTAYLADHLIQEQRGAGAEYRQTTLQKYADYVSRSRDFPLVEFRERHSPATEAVGYGRSLMLFHELRREVGDEAFVEGLRSFYEHGRFRLRGFDDIRLEMEKVSGLDLSVLFDQATRRTGAPRLRIVSATATAAAGGSQTGPAWLLNLTLEQHQDGEPYTIGVPVAVTVEGSDRAIEDTVRMTGRTATAELKLPARPLRVDVDPSFDVFRRLDLAEIPPALSQAFGAETALAVLPAAAPRESLEAWRAVVASWQGEEGETIEVRLDDELRDLPKDRSVWIFGWENRFRAALAPGLSPYGASLDGSGLRVGTASHSSGDRSVALTVRRPETPELTLSFVAAAPSEAISGLGRKLPHYHKYSWLAFEGDEPVNIAKERWPVVNSPMTRLLPSSSGGTAAVPMARLAPRQALASLPPAFSKERMMETIRALTDPAMNGRGFGSEGLAASVQRIAEAFRDAGLAPAGDTPGSYEQVWTARGGSPEREARLVNLVGMIPGTNPDRAGESVVIGAHYDHLGLGWPEARHGNEGRIHPGADDNASGVAVLLELARQLASGAAPDRTIVFVAFSGEEAGRLGSMRYVERASAAAAPRPIGKVIGMVNLDTVGRLGEGKLLVLGTGSASEWVHIFNGAGYVTGVPVQGVADDLGSSDQKSFLDAGIPAVQLFTGPHPEYHSPADTADLIDAEGLVKVASVAREAIDYLAGRPEPLTIMLKPAGAAGEGAHGAEASPPPQGRKVSLGTVPDFAFQGSGVRLGGVVPGSPAEKAGLREGDVVVRLAGKEVADLRALSDILKSLSPGDRVDVVFLRDGAEQTVRAEIVAR